MDEKTKFQLSSEIISAIIRNANIEVVISKRFEEVGLRDKEGGGYILVHELIDYLTRYIKD